MIGPDTVEAGSLPKAAASGGTDSAAATGTRSLRDVGMDAEARTFAGLTARPGRTDRGVLVVPAAAAGAGGDAGPGRCRLAAADERVVVARGPADSWPRWVESVSLAPVSADACPSTCGTAIDNPTATAAAPNPVTAAVLAPNLKSVTRPLVRPQRRAVLYRNDRTRFALSRPGSRPGDPSGDLRPVVTRVREGHREGEVVKVVVP